MLNSSTINSYAMNAAGMGGHHVDPVPDGGNALGAHLPGMVGVGSAEGDTDYSEFQYKFRISDALEITVRLYNPSRRWSVPSSRIAQTIYICTLDDIRLPMSSFQARLRDGQPTYFGAVVPMEDGVVEAIQARTGGTLTLFSGIITASGDEILEPMTVTTLHSLRYDKGARSGSITVVGYVTETTTTSKVVDLTGISTEGLQADGRRTVRCEPSFFLRPGDVARWNGQQMIVGMIALTVNPRSATMDVSER